MVAVGWLVVLLDCLQEFCRSGYVFVGVVILLDLLGTPCYDHRVLVIPPPVV